jgi:EAL domain-containing protein (putative c-di-GMP-specific phosphodiesterase class I)
LYPEDAKDTTSLIKYADTAMYHAKSLGRNNFQFYTEQLNQYATRYVQLEAGLKKAIQDNELYLVYQPKYDVKTEKIIGVEALMRWESPELGLISPVEFIPLAEETGIINQIGHWAINQACSQLAQWHALGFEHISVAVNLSARQLKADIISIIEVALAVSGLPASALELELTESMIMGNPQDSVAILAQLKALGLTIAVDDFGTGYSSLSYLKRFPIDTLKIDKEFVRDITEDPDDAAITSAIITLAHSLDLNVVAEGVETQAQLNFLREGGCDQVQGFLLSKPLSADDCMTLLTYDKTDTRHF